MSDKKAARQEISSFKLLLSFNWNKALLLVLGAGFLWGWLPVGYKILNANSAIKAQPFITVGMRFLSAAAIILTLTLITFIISRLLGTKGDKTAFHYIIMRSFKMIFTPAIGFIAAASFFYFGARALEMSKFLTFTIPYDEILANSQNTFERTIYQPGNSTSLQEAVSNSAQSFGYFMGLVLIMGWSFKGWLFRGLYAYGKKHQHKWISKNFVVKIVGNADRLPNATGMIYWILSLFLVVIAGALLVYAREPVFSTSYSYILPMLGWAFLIGFLTSVFLDFNMLASLLDNSKEKEGIPLTWKDYVVSSTLMYLVLSVIVSFLAFVCGMLKSGMTFTQTIDLCSLYLTEGRWIGLIVIIAILGSVTAPIVRLVGIKLYDQKMAVFDGKAVSGADWQRVGSCFEPLFVLIMGLFLPLLGFEGESFVNMTAMWLAIIAVVLISLLKMAEIWAEKNADIRQSAFAARRDELTVFHKKDLPEDTLFAHALELSKLKFFSDRHNLEKLNLALQDRILNHQNTNGDLQEFFYRAERYLYQGNYDGALSNTVCRVNLVILQNGYTFFNADDPQSQAALASHFAYLNNQNRMGNKLISMDWLMQEMDLSSSEIAKYRNALGAERNDMPIMILNDKNADSAVAPDNAVVICGTEHGKKRYDLNIEALKTFNFVDIPVDKQLQDKVLDTVESTISQNYSWIFMDVEVWNAIVLRPDIRAGERKLSERFAQCRVVWFGTDLEVASMQSIGLHNESDMPFIKLDLAQASSCLEATINNETFATICQMAEKRFASQPVVNVFINPIDADENKRFDKLNQTVCFASLALTGTNGKIQIASDRKDVEDLCRNATTNFAPQTANASALTFVKTEYKTWNKNADTDLLDIILSVHYAFNIKAFKSPLKKNAKIEPDRLMVCSLESVCNAVAKHCGVRKTTSPWGTDFYNCPTVIERWNTLLTRINSCIHGALEREVNAIVYEHFTHNDKGL